MSNETNKRFFNAQGNKIYLNTYKCEIYVPDYYFEVKLAVQDGEIFDLFFIAKYRLFHTESAETSKQPIYDFNIPTMILTKPDEVYRADLDLYGTMEKFRVFVYYKEGEIIYNNNIVKNSDSVERYVTLLNDGKIRVPYSKVNDVTNKVQTIHDVKLGVPQYIQQLVVSEVYRDKNDLSVPARFVAKANDKDNSNLKGLNMRENSAFTSTLAGVGFEDVKSMLTVSDNRDDKGPQELSKIERVIKGIR